MAWWKSHTNSPTGVPTFSRRSWVRNGATEAKYRRRPRQMGSAKEPLRGATSRLNCSIASLITDFLHMDEDIEDVNSTGLGYRFQFSPSILAHHPLQRQFERIRTSTPKTWWSRWKRLMRWEKSSRPGQSKIGDEHILQMIKHGCLCLV